MSTYKFAMEGSTGKTTRYEAYLKDGKLVDVTKLGAKEIRMSFSYGQRLYAAAKKGMFSLSHARGHEEDIKTEVIRKRYRGRGQPKKPSAKHAKQSQQSKTAEKTWAVKRAIGLAIEVYDPLTGWSYGGYKQVSEVYRTFRDVFDGDAPVNPKSPVAPISMCEGHIRHHGVHNPHANAYAWLKVDDTVSGNDEGRREFLYWYWTIPKVDWSDMCHLKYTLEQLDELIHNDEFIKDQKEKGCVVTFMGLAAYDYGFRRVNE